MTNAELLAKIKAEIERRIIYAIGFRDNVEQEERASFFNGEAVALKHLLSFLSTLESEKPMILDGLDEEVHSFFDECIDVHEVPLYGKVKEDVITADCYEITARHFAKWGAEHLKK